MTADRPGRRDELAARLLEVRRRIEVACAAAGRAAESVELVAVTKTHPVTDLEHLAALGVRHVGENRDQEARAKHDAYAGPRVTWHFVGGLQTNKCRSVAAYADVVQTVDRLRLVDPLARAAAAAGRALTVLVQVSLDEDPRRGGVRPADVPDLAAAVVAREPLVLGGVMGVAPLGAEPRAAFDLLASVAERLRADHPGAGWVSAGMSSDLEEAVAAGATHLRVGTALLGGRPPSVR